MTETKERKVARKGFIIALGIICVILVACLGGVIAAYTFVLSDKDKTISSLTSQISELSSNVSNIMSDPSAWVNKTVVVEGSIEYAYSYLQAPPWNYKLSSNGATIGVSWQGNNDFLSKWVDTGVNVLVLGVITEGQVTPPINGTHTYNVYFIEAETIDKL
jgi:hypothetical protein